MKNNRIYDPGAPDEIITEINLPIPVMELLKILREIEETHGELPWVEQVGSVLRITKHTPPTP
ncbi:MAG: hypothetical protein H0U18_03400 [Pyrinomonadaceae bacterium]|nr:hypothetical protein [Pyrinomonadaceae bacterium]